MKRLMLYSLMDLLTFITGTSMYTTFHYWDGDVMIETTNNMMILLLAGVNEDLVVYVYNYSCGVHEVILSGAKAADKPVNHLMVEISLAKPIIGTKLELSMLSETVGKNSSFFKFSKK